jgi:alkaline phosphatase
MNRSSLRILSILSVLGSTSSVALAAPTEVTVTPPDGARFVQGQRFDIRVEGKGTGPFSATLTLDGKPLEFTSGEQASTTTDGITSDGYGGFNVRGYANEMPGVHTLEATFRDATGTSSAKADFEVVPLRGGLGKTRNVIIMLGDGMGTAHRTAARLVRHGVAGGDPNGFLAMDSFPATGLVTTHSLNSIITDSAPGMAGYVTGSHAMNGQEGVYPAHVTNPFFSPRVEYMSEFLHREQGKSLGLVSTADLEDATPAANAVHTGNRNAGTGIVDQYLDESDRTGLSVLLGGGRRWFLPDSVFGSSRSAATDYPALPEDLVTGWHLSKAGASDPSRNLGADFQSAGFQYVETASALNGLLGNGRAPDKLLGLFAYGNMNVALDKLAKRRGQLLPGSSTFVVDEYRAPDQPMLDEMTQAALRVLSHSPRGFVLMVEGAHIDKQSHAMDAERAVGDTLEFDRAVGVARDFAARDRHTLVIVLADHECSGFSIIGGLTGTVAQARALSPDGATLAPTSAPARQSIVGTYDAAGFPHYNILADGYPETFDIDHKILFGYGANGDRFETWLTRPRPIIDSLLPTAIKTELAAAGYPAEPVNRSQTDGFFIRGQATGASQAVHTASDIPISAYSASYPVAHAFVGVQRNTDVFFKLMNAVVAGD